MPSLPTDMPRLAPQDTPGVALQSPARVISAAFALTGFSTAVLAGLAAHNPGTTVLSRAILCMALCYALGMIAGQIVERVIREHVESHRKSNPLPEDPVAFPEKSTDVEVVGG